jgi:hypothetical protein
MLSWPVDAQVAGKIKLEILQGWPLKLDSTCGFTTTIASELEDDDVDNEV